MVVTFTKLRSGDWGLRVAGGTVKPGQSVTVQKKDGSTDTKTIKTVIWSGNGVTLCAIADGRSRSSSQSSWTGCACGSRDGEPRDSDCWECRHNY